MILDNCLLGDDRMNKSEIYTHSVLTFAFTNDGRKLLEKIEMER